ncbi:conserved hypothetical protein [Sphingomonas sp. EC-HK361]|uniref:TadE/TadG family type IV pilus assembly protein n=1 Tax=Sphingomonas sp. EC-HK361 TaxID=2038397 RepID=UPI001257F600|nr:TadE/TadG family type IV pilus assembly protein [Sphingomonas sp. EC-HK361]VVT08799.1 conserved hypothetical protein [Sphingomonas sp. EC-HK361]
MIARAARALRAARAFVQDRRAVGAIEFAMTAPFLILLYLGGYQLMDAISAYRKTSMTVRTMADVTTQFTSMQAADVDNVMAAATSVMTPYAASNAVTRVSEIWINPGTQPKVKWSRSKGGQPLKNSDLNNLILFPNGVVPAALRVPDTYLVFAEISYSYTPIAGGKLIGPITFKDQLFMNPRRSNDIPCSDC